MVHEEKTKEQLIEELEEARRCIAEMEESAKRQARYDHLTGLPNRALFSDHLKLALADARRYRHMVAAIVLDLNRFKVINDSLGRSSGDQVLQAVPHRLKTCLREGDIVARMGDDEYAIVLPRILHEEDAVTIARKILSAFEQPYRINGHELYVTASIGVSLYPDDGQDPETLMQNADTAMHYAKEQGRADYQFYNKSMRRKAYRRMLMESNLHEALEKGNLSVYYQPQVDIATNEVVCVEALVRWQHPELGLLSPVQFIPLAEETGLITLIDEWVLRTACAQRKAWQDSRPLPLCIIVNLSAREFLKPDFAEKVSRILSETAMDSRFLGLEITESTAVQDIEISIARMERLSSMGIQFSIDDFGKEFLSLRRLRKLPITKLKIDRSFISSLETDSDYKTIIPAVISTAHEHNLKVVAEGVETESQLSFLRSSRCDEAQGYLISQPLPADELEKAVLARH